MKRNMRILLVAGLLIGGLALFSPSSEAGPWGRGGVRRGGWGRGYGPGWGYRAYRPNGWGGYGLGYRPLGGGFGRAGWGYPGYGPGFRGYGINNPALGVFGGGYPGYFGANMPYGSPMGGFSMNAYPF